MTPKSASINWVTIWLEQLDFCLNRCKWEFPDQHIAHCILPPELFFSILIISTVCSHDMSLVTKFLDKAKFLISERDSCWELTLWLFWPDQHTYCFRCVVYNVMRSFICATYRQECLKSSYRGWLYTTLQVTPYHPHNSVNLPRHLLHSTLLLLHGGDCLGHLCIHYIIWG